MGLIRRTVFVLPFGIPLARNGHKPTPIGVYDKGVLADRNGKSDGGGRRRVKHAFELKGSGKSSETLGFDLTLFNMLKLPRDNIEGTLERISAAQCKVCGCGGKIADSAIRHYTKTDIAPLPQTRLWQRHRGRCARRRNRCRG